MLVIVAALGLELRHIEPLVQVERRARVEDCSLIWGTASGTSVALVQCGIGKERALAGARVAFDTCRAETVIVLGMAGSTQPGLRMGTLFLAEEVASSESGLAPIRSQAPLLARATQALEGAPVRVSRGRLLTAAQVLGPEEKRRTGAALGVQAVDMESYWVAKSVMEAHVPVLAVRAISDEVGAWLPDYSRLQDRMGRVRPLGAAFYVLSHPHRLAALASLARNARRASESLGMFTDRFLRVNASTAEDARG